MNRQGVSLMALVITIMVIVILAAFGIYKTNLILHRTQLAVFLDNFSKYSEQIEIDTMNLKHNLGVKEKSTNPAQLNYMVANGLKHTDDKFVFGYTTPVGYVLPDSIMRLYGYDRVTDTASNEPRLPFLSSVAYANDLLNTPDGPTYDIANSYAVRGDPIPMVAYVIDDVNIDGFDGRPNNSDGSAGREFYGDSNGSEYHFVTSNGHVLTLPGYPVLEDDGSMTFYISNDKRLYYVASSASGLGLGMMNINGDKITEPRPIQAVDLAEAGPWGLTSTNEWINSYSYDPDTSSFGTPGRYTSIGNPSNLTSSSFASNSNADSTSTSDKEENKIPNDKIEKVKIDDKISKDKITDKVKQPNSWVKDAKKIETKIDEVKTKKP